MIIGSLQTTLGDLVESGEGFIQTGPFGSQLHAHDYAENGIPIVMPQQLGDNEISEYGIAQINEQDRDRLIRHVMRVGDIVFSRRGDVTRRAYITGKEDGWLCGTGCLLLRLNHPQCDNRYLVRFLGLHETRSYLTQHAIGATMPNLNQRILASVPVVLPPRDHQERIIGVISAYDDLIENNRRRIQLLEQAARLLYKEWFVHLRFPGHEDVKIKDGVPEGWQKRSGLDIMDVMSGGTPKVSVPNYWGGEIPFFTSKDTTDYAYVFRTERTLTEEGLNNCNSRLYPKDTVFITARGTVGKINLAQTDMAMNQSCYALIAKPPLNQQFLYFALAENVEQFRSRAVGAIFDAIIRDTFKLIPFLVPDSRLIKRFVGVVSPTLRQIDVLSTQLRKLVQARSIILPRLMSGEVAV